MDENDNNVLTTNTQPGEKTDSLDHPEDVVTNTMTQLPFESLIGGPLSACVLAQRQAAETTKEFIENVGFKTKGNSEDLEVISMNFLFQQNGMYKKLSVPLLTIIPIPYMTIDSIDIGFRADMVATKEGKLYGKFSNAKDSSVVKNSKYDIRNQIDVNIHASSSSMPPGMAALLDIFGNRCIQVNDLTDDEIASYDQATRDEIAKKKEAINEYAEQEAERIEKAGHQKLEEELGSNPDEAKNKYAVRLLKYPPNKDRGKVIAAFMNSCTSQKLNEQEILKRMTNSLSRTIVANLSIDEAMKIEKAVDATGYEAKVVEM